MRVTEVRIKLVQDQHDGGKLLAFCTITMYGEFVVRDIKVLEGPQGLFLAMPSRKLTDRCRCGGKNHLRARFCNDCGQRLDENRAMRLGGPAKLYGDIAHPIRASARGEVEQAVLQAYRQEVERSKQPDYVCRYDMYDSGD